MIINVDAGEGRAGDPKDLQLLDLADALNLAVGGHAGDPIWIRELAARALELGRAVHLHPSFPDRENFGRVRMNLSWSALEKSLSAQRAVLAEVNSCKFHGALYHVAAYESEMAGRLAAWCVQQGIEQVVTPPDSALARAAEDHEVNVLREGFADRAYVRDAQGQLGLCPRQQLGAVITDPEIAVAQASAIAFENKVSLLHGGTAALTCDTLCFHGDGANAVAIGRALQQWKEAHA